VVVLEHATESLTAFDSASNEIRIITWLNQLIFKFLIISFCVVVLAVFTNGLLK
jgi:hypothetical protein